MTSGESSLRMPKEATCDVECAMKVESLRILSKKRKQSRRVGDRGVNSKGAAAGNSSAKATKCALPSSATPSGTSTPEFPEDYNPESGEAAPALSKAPSISVGSSKEAKEAARRRFVWSVPLHQDFVAAVFDVGLKCASPKLLLEMMPVVDGLTSENIKSHLQKYRLHRQRSREEFLKSYGYLTDLDGAKTLGGGSAAATIKAAAAAAGDVKGPFLGGAPGPPDSGQGKVACGGSCECNDASSPGGGGVPPDGTLKPHENGEQKLLYSEGSAAEADRGIALLSNTVPYGIHGTRAGNGAEWGGGQEGGKADAGAGQQLAVGTEATAEPLRQQGDVNHAQVANSALLLSHLELLGRGIDLQVKFQQHLREVVESQQTLQAQLLGKRGRPPQLASDTTGSPRVVANTSERTEPTVIGLPTRDEHTSGVRGKRRNQTLGAPRSIDAGRPRLGYRSVPEYTQDAPSQGGRWVVAGSDKAAGAPSPRRTGDPTRRNGPQTGMDTAGTLLEGSVADVQGIASADSADHARADPGALRSVQRQSDLRDSTDESGRAPRQLNPAAMRAAFSLHGGAAGLSLPPGALSMGRQGLGMAQRGYVPGEYTLISNNPETAVGGGPPHARGSAGLVVGMEAAAGGGGGVERVHPGVLAARNPAEARAALAAVGLAPATPTTAPGQETVALQRHMQAQMEMQQTMLEACVDQATPFGGQRAWGGARAGPSVGAFGGGGGVGNGNGGRHAEAGDTHLHHNGARDGGRECGGGGAGAGDGGEGAGGVVGNKEGRLDSLRLHPPDMGDPSLMMGLLQQDDEFDFSLLDRGGELKPEENSHPNRAAGEDYSSLFSFLME